MSRRQISGKRFVITGATSGLGYSICQLLRSLGGRLLVTGRNEIKLQEFSAECKDQKSKVEWLAGDITDSDFRKCLIETCIAQFGGIDCLVNNAGIGAMGRFDEANEERLRKIFDVNFFAMTELIRLAIPNLKRGEDPQIVNIGSVLGHRAVPLKSEYCASKFAVHGFSDALRTELRGDGIEVLHVCPATIATPFFDSAIEDSTGIDWTNGSKMSPNFVARQTILAMKKRKSELVIPWSAKGLVWLDRLLPQLADYFIAKYGQ